MLHQIASTLNESTRDVRSRDPMTDEVTDLLQHLIRNACVNDGTEASG